MTPSITILMYHQVGTFPAPRAHRAVYCDAGAFRRQMAFLRAGRYNVLRLDEVVACIHGERDIPPRAVHLTFDDGYDDFATTAWPAMRRHRFPADVYVISELLGRSAEWLGEAGLPTAQLMDAATARGVGDQGAVLGCHTATHAHLSQIMDPAERDRQIIASRHSLEASLNRTVDAFCYPYGDLDRVAVETVRRAGYRSAFTCERNRAVRGMDPLLLPRHAVSYGTSLAGLWWKLHVQKPGKPLSL